MKKFWSICIVILFISQFVSSQDYSIEFGRITQKEMDLKRYPTDTSATAAVLYDIGTSFFLNTNDGFRLVFERRTKVKIFTKAGFDHSIVEIPYYQEGIEPERVMEIEAYTYNMNNGVLEKTALKKENIFDEKMSENYNIKKFTLPDIREGSIIEFKYRIESPYFFNLNDWEFQTDIPVSYSKYTVKMVPFYSYTFLLQGANKFSNYISYESNNLPQYYGGIQYLDLIHEYTMVNMSAFRDEEFITSKSDCIIKLDFQLSKVYHPDGTVINVVSTWPNLCNELLKDENFGKYINGCEGKASKIIEGLNIINLSPEEKLKTIVDYVKSNYAWNGYNRVFATQSVKEFIDTKTGNSANINLFLLAMLNVAGMDAYPVILSTRDHGKIKADYPFLKFFNYVAVLVNIDEKPILTDATEVLLPYFMIPAKCINENGLVVQKKKTEWVQLTNTIPSVTENQFVLEFNNELDSLRGDFNKIATRYDALELREFINDKDENKKNYVEKRSYTLLSGITTENFNNLEQPYQISYKAAVPVENINGKIYISPFLTVTYTENPLKAKVRSYPLDMIYTKKRVFYASIKIPDNYKVSSLPLKTLINHDFFVMNYQAVVVENKVVVTADYCFTKPVYEALDYKIIKFFFMELVNKMNQKIVLEKIN